MSNTHEHDENCECTKATVNSEALLPEDAEDATVTLTMEDDSEVECAVIAIYPAGDKEYIALLPLDDEGENEDGEVYLYRYLETDEEATLENIEDDAEYEVAADAFDEILDKAEFDEISE